jgi:hypothetical protein
MRGRVLLCGLTKSDKFNASLTAGGTLAPLLYVTTYIYADDWGHLPFDPRWVVRECLPDAHTAMQDPAAEVAAAMDVLLAVGLWEHVYAVGNKKYVYIYNFDTLSESALRFRRRGVWPDESGHIPTRRADESMKTSIAQARAIRSVVKRAGTGRH